MQVLVVASENAAHRRHLGLVTSLATAQPLVGAAHQVPSQYGPKSSPGGGSSRRPFTACWPIVRRPGAAHQAMAHAVALACAASKIGLSSTSFEAASQVPGPVLRRQGFHQHRPFRAMPLAGV
jgi:hypothetical protein